MLILKKVLAAVMISLLAPMAVFAQTPPPIPGQVPAVQYHVALNNQPQGPFDMAKLTQLAASGQFTKDSLVWTQGMANWAAAGTRPDLQPLFRQAQPLPLPTPQPAPVPQPGPTPQPNPQPIPGPQPAPGPTPQIDQAKLQQMEAYERQDLGVPATAQLHAGAMHGATPASIPGGQLITTRGLVELVQRRDVKYLVLDVLGGQETLPGALQAVQASQGGSFSDQTQQVFGQFLQQATQGNKQVAIVLYCLSRECWMSYNAALRAINLGYTNVLWYRGGIEAWKQAGLPTTPPGQRQ